MSARPSLRRDEGGFVLILVLFVMAALTLTVSGALLVTQSDHATARASVDASRAFHLAQAGLSRFVSERTSTTQDSVVYEMSGGRVVVRARRISTNGMDEVHEIAARATVRSAGAISEVREVRQLAVLELRPINPPGGFATTARNATLVGTFSGTDLSSSGQCPAAARGHRTGFVGVNGGFVDTRFANLQGQPVAEMIADTAQARARISAEWEELLDPATPFDYDIPAVSWPAFALLPVDRYPTIRVRGDFYADATRSGRGMLVVEGRINFGPDFVWDGAIIAGDLVNPIRSNATVRGSFMAGLNQNANASVNIGGNSSGYPRFGYDACKVLWSTRGLARFRLLANTWSEIG